MFGHVADKLAQLIINSGTEFGCVWMAISQQYLKLELDIREKNLKRVNQLSVIVELN